MNLTTKSKNDNRLLINTTDLMSYLSCGKPTAVDVGTKAKAKVQLGRLVFWNIEKVKNYLNDIATE